MPVDSPGKNIGVGCHFLLQGIFLTQGSIPSLPKCRQILYYLSHWEACNQLYPKTKLKKKFKKITKKKEITFTVYTNTSNTSMHTYTQQNISQLNCFRQDNARYFFVLCFACLFVLFLALFFLLVIGLASRICIFNLEFIYLKIILYHDTL